MDYPDNSHSLLDPRIDPYADQGHYDGERHQQFDEFRTRKLHESDNRQAPGGKARTKPDTFNE